MESFTNERAPTPGSGASSVVDALESTNPPKLPSSQYKGVVPQPNGRWGAQIYQNHHRVWLGTFNDETQAAHAYDVAVQRFRGCEAVTNFTSLSSPKHNHAAELTFIQSQSKDVIVDMLRKHTYHDELERSRTTYQPTENMPETMTMVLQPLFEKTVTPSDVGKLNRLVIPKLHAEKHLPLHGGGKGMLLSLVDRSSGAVWRIRYSYWNSSQSYVLTKGWSRFVREKGLMVGDVVRFMRSTGPERQLYIDHRVERGAVETEMKVVGGAAARVVMLFGVNICGWQGQKRGREVEELASSHVFKRQRIEALLC